MSYDQALEREFSLLEPKNFVAYFFPPKVFICGGVVSLDSKSLRNAIINHFDDNNEDVYSAIVKAEDFIDYFRDGAYSDLLQFENDIANIATLIVICLESPGSLVELGIFCTNPLVANRLLVIAPQREVERRDSFIYHGPLESLKRKSPDSVIVYPFPQDEAGKYEHTEFIASDIVSKLESSQKTEPFDGDNPAHIAFLIYEIVLIAHPIKLHEIEAALKCVGVVVDSRTLHRLLYLLDIVGLVTHTTYSSVNYYYDKSKGERRILFGLLKNGEKRDTPAMKVAIRQSFVLAQDESSKKRTNALKQIQSIKPSAQPAQPAQPVQPAQPAQPAQPVDAEGRGRNENF